ncbi:MAG: hypothetical protein II008_03775 [Oscillospiraceae bacterium]|nr:hypothetical protein [Oscillospiraceae bacterium]
MKEPIKPNGVHEKCLLTCDCVATIAFAPVCFRCGFYKPEAERRRKLPLVFCEDGKQRKFIRRE